MSGDQGNSGTRDNRTAINHVYTGMTQGWKGRCVGNEERICCQACIMRGMMG